MKHIILHSHELSPVGPSGALVGPLGGHPRGRWGTLNLLR
jgi:hypothetical protein